MELRTFLLKVVVSGQTHKKVGKCIKSSGESQRSDVFRRGSPDARIFRSGLLHGPWPHRPLR